MNDLEDLIRYENENTCLDFKAVQYLKPNYEALIKDIMAMANANISGDRYIIIGVKHRPDGSREFLSIGEQDFVDQATYQQLLRENVEPEVHFEYSPYRIDEHLLGVFRIFGCEEQPYMMRKAYGSGLRQGDGFIRKGTHQPRLMRQDLARIISIKADSGFTGTIRIVFDSRDASTEINLRAARCVQLPSDLAADKINKILAERAELERNQLAKWQILAMNSALMRTSILGPPPPYEHRSTEELQKNLENVKKTYREDDLYTQYEENASKINLVIVNEGATYVEDASICVEIPKIKGLKVPTGIYQKPDKTNSIYTKILHPSFDDHRYPTVHEINDVIRVETSLGDLRHGRPVLAFERSLRVVLDEELIGKTLNLNCQLFGKQLPRPREETLAIHVIAPEETHE